MQLSLRRAASLAAVAGVAVTLEGCGGDDEPSTTLTTTFACLTGIPWPHEDTSSGYYCQSIEEARFEADTFLTENMPPWDIDNNATLQTGIIQPTLNLSLTARDEFGWAELIPRDVWRNYVLPYANVNEPRVDWRTLLHDKLLPLVQNPKYQANTTADVVNKLNEELWSALRTPAIEFKSDQTPLIYDPFSVIQYGYASCTGVSIMLVDALRSVGVPARLAGTPAWHGNASNGNHNWVEVWLGPGEGLDGTDWTFIEAKPAGPGEKLMSPCDKWFCNPAHFDGKTQVFATMFDRKSNKTVYPLAWGPSNLDIPGVNRTDFYNSVCQKCTSRFVQV